MKTFKLLISAVLMSFLTLNQVNSQDVFYHLTKKNNIAGHITTLDHTSVNGQAGKLLFITQRYGKYNDHQVGVYYEGNRWKIYNEDIAAMPDETMFNVLAVNPSDRAFQHQSSKANISNNWTIIDHPKTNNNPNAILLVTQNWKGTYNTKPIGVWYTNGKWAIFNQDRSAMPEKVNFNVLVLEEGRQSGLQGATAGLHTAAKAEYISPVSETKSNAVLFITQNFRNQGQYNNHFPSVWHNGASWTVYNQDKAAMNVGAMFNVITFNAGAGTTTQIREDEPVADASVSTVAWISRHYEFLKDKPLNQLVLPGSHDSGTHNLDGTWHRGVNDPFAPDTDDLKRGLSFLGAGYDKWAKAQERSIYQQLEDGIRYLDIRVCVDKSDNMKTCHGLYGASLAEVINDVVKFSNKYPKEPIFIDFNHFYDWSEKIRNNKENEAGYTGIRTSKLNELSGMIERSLGPRLAPNSLSPTTKLKELVGTRRPIVVFWSKPLSGTFQNQYFWKTSQITNSYSNDIKEIRNDKIHHLDKQIRANQNSNQFFLLAAQITPSNELYKNAYDFTGTYPFGLESLARESNPVVLSYLANEWKNLRHNIIAIDFYNQTSLVELCKQLNGLPANPTGVSKADRDKSTWGSWKLGAGTLFAGSSENEWSVEIDACHSELSNTETSNRITVQFWAGPDRVASKYMDGVSNTCKIWEGNATFSIKTTRNITHVIVKTNGNDGFYIDELYLYKAGELMQHHGRDDGSGWCLSTDANDAGGDWSGKVAGSTCRSQYQFNY